LNSKVLLGLLDDWMRLVREAVATNGPAWIFKFVVFVLVMVVARLLAGIAARVVRRAVSVSRMQFSSRLQEFFVKVAFNIVLVLGVLLALAQVGVHLGPVLAGLGVAGLIIGFALQDTLSNFASGLMILIYRPFDIDDVVEAGGVSGKVKQMSLVSTTILTFDNQKLVVPNNKIWGDVIRNVNAAPTRRVDLVFGIGYEDDVDAAEAVLREIISAHELVLKEPEPTIKLHTLGESSVDFIVRPWVLAGDYWTVYWDVTRAVKVRFDAAGITIPYPQRDVHIHEVAPE
jgi:small conductance mechanosensitive channel